MRRGYQLAREPVDERLRDVRRLALADALQQHGELVAAEARHRVARAHAILVRARDVDEQPIAGGVTERVVELLEAIQVDQQQRTAGVLEPLRAQVAVEQLGETPPVRQARQIVAVGQPPPLELALAASRDVDERDDDARAAVAGVQRRRRHLQPGQATLALDAEQQVALDRARPQRRQRRQRRGVEIGAVLADQRELQLVRAPALQGVGVAAQEPLGGRIRRHDPALLVQHDDAVLECGHDCTPVDHSRRSPISGSLALTPTVESRCQPRRESQMASTGWDTELKARHRAMWASGDYPSMVESFLLPLGPRLVAACDIGPGVTVLDVAAGTGNASLPAAQRGARVTASDLTPELLEAGRRRAEAEALELDWVEADAERLPFDDESFDVVMSCIGAMFAPRHQDVAAELVRVCRRGGTIGMLNWTPEGMIGALFRTMGPFAPPPPPGAQPPPLWGSEDHVRELFGDRVEFRTLERDVLDITAFEHPHDYGKHFKDKYGPTIAAQANARKNGREDEFLEAVDRFCDEWNRGTDERARFEQEYLVAVGTRA